MQHELEVRLRTNMNKVAKFGSSILSIKSLIKENIKD